MRDTAFEDILSEIGFSNFDKEAQEHAETKKTFDKISGDFLSSPVKHRKYFDLKTSMSFALLLAQILSMGVMLFLLRSEIQALKDLNSRLSLIIEQQNPDLNNEPIEIYPSTFPEEEIIELLPDPPPEFSVA